MGKFKLTEFDQQFDHIKISPNSETQITRLHEQTGFSDKIVKKNCINVKYEDLIFKQEIDNEIRTK